MAPGVGVEGRLASRHASVLTLSFVWVFLEILGD